jgi:hypothetical protein
MDKSFLGSRGASRGILLMWDSRVVEKIEECGKSRLEGRILLCLIIVILKHGLELTGSFYLQIKKNIFRMLLSNIFLESCRITFL